MDTETTTSDLVTTAEAGIMLSCSYRTVLRMVESGELKQAAKVPGKTGAYLFHRVDVLGLADVRSAQDGAA